MSLSANSEFLDRSSVPLPTERDFDPHQGDLDAQWAWKNFGGLSLNQAYGKFLSRPEIYQEDFMFMGIRAFDYYFPVIDRYLREVSIGEDHLGDCEASILGCAAAAQLGWTGAVLPERLLLEMDDLRRFVTDNVARYAATPKDRRRILRDWRRVANEMEQYQTANKSGRRG
ncbi:MAG TPA: hypothetical protein VIS74_04105 [Chthoniobacterales bacterium]